VEFVSLSWAKPEQLGKETPSLAELNPTHLSPPSINLWQNRTVRWLPHFRLGGAEGKHGTSGGAELSIDFKAVGVRGFVLTGAPIIPMTWWIFRLGAVDGLQPVCKICAACVPKLGHR